MPSQFHLNFIYLLFKLSKIWCGKEETETKYIHEMVTDVNLHYLPNLCFLFRIK